MDTAISERTVALALPKTGLPSPEEWDVMQRMAKMFEASGLYKQVANVAQAIAIVQTGRELGIGPSMALREMYIIPGQGRPSLSAALLAALVQRDHGDDAIRVVESTSERCRVLYKRRGWTTPAEVVFTIEDARRALLIKEKGNWEKYPRQMLKARAISEACREGFQDSIMGLYATEEMAPERVTVTEDGEIVLSADVDAVDATADATADAEPAATEPAVTEQTLSDGQRVNEELKRLRPPQAGQTPVSWINSIIKRDNIDMHPIEVWTDATVGYRQRLLREVQACDTKRGQSIAAAGIEVIEGSASDEPAQDSFEGPASEDFTRLEGELRAVSPADANAGQQYQRVCDVATQCRQRGTMTEDELAAIIRQATELTALVTPY